MSFECQPDCAACCRNVAHLTLPSKDGVCLHLRDNKCSIYTSRPLICRVDEMYTAHRIYDKMSIEEWYSMNKKACGELRATIYR